MSKWIAEKNTDKNKDSRDKHEKFLEIAERRASAVIEGIRLLSNLSNKNNYYYEEEEVSKMFAAIQFELRKSKSFFDKNINTRENKPFKFKR